MIPRITLILSLLLLAGCGAVAHVFDTGVDTPHQAWADAEAQRLAPMYGTPADIDTRFLDIGPQGTGFGEDWYGWNDGVRITIVLREHDGTPIPDWKIHNVWHHEIWHTYHGGIRLDSAHNAEYQRELIDAGLWEWQ